MAIPFTVRYSDLVTLWNGN